MRGERLVLGTALVAGLVLASGAVASYVIGETPCAW